LNTVFDNGYADAKIGLEMAPVQECNQRRKTWLDPVWNQSQQQRARREALSVQSGMLKEVFVPENLLACKGPVGSLAYGIDTGTVCVYLGPLFAVDAPVFPKAVV